MSDSSNLVGSKSDKKGLTESAGTQSKLENWLRDNWPPSGQWTCDDAWFAACNTLGRIELQSVNAAAMAIGKTFQHVVKTTAQPQVDYDELANAEWNVRRHPKPKKAIVDTPEAKQARAERGKMGAATRRKKKALSATPYGQFLLALEQALDANDQAKARAADGTSYRDYRNRSQYRWSNYGNSRDARERDYRLKAEAVAKACTLAGGLNVPFGWKKDGTEHVPWVIYFELTDVGQVSFHATERGGGPDYAGKWDGVKDAGRGRVDAAIKTEVERATSCQKTQS